MTTPLQKMTELLPGLDGANLRLAKWYLDMVDKNIEIVLRYDSSDVASAVGVSRATVMRFARKLGYPGFPEFRHALMVNSIAVMNERKRALSIKPGSDMLNFVYNSQIDALTMSMQAIDPASFEKSARWLADAPNTMWIGWGDSYFAAASAEHKCHIGGIPARSLDNVPDVGLYLDMLPPDSVVVVVSHSGQWTKLADALKAFQARGGRVISIVGKADVLAYVADVAFVTPNPTFGVGVRLITWRPAQHMLLDALVFEATRLKGQQNMNFPSGVT